MIEKNQFLPEEDPSLREHMRQVDEEWEDFSRGKIESKPPERKEAERSVSVHDLARAHYYLIAFLKKDILPPGMKAYEIPYFLADQIEKIKAQLQEQEEEPPRGTEEKISQIHEELNQMTLKDLLRGNVGSKKAAPTPPKEKSLAERTPRERELGLLMDRMDIVATDLQRLLDEDILLPDLRASEIPAFLQDQIKKMES